MRFDMVLKILNDEKLILKQKFSPSKEPLIEQEYPCKLSTGNCTVFNFVKTKFSLSFSFSIPFSNQDPGSGSIHNEKSDPDGSTQN